MEGAGDVVEPVLEGVIWEAGWEAERDAEDLADGACVLGSVEAAQGGVMAGGALGEGFVDPLENGGGFVGGRARLAFWRHFICGQHAVNVFQKAGCVRRGEVEGGEVEVDSAFGFIGVMARCAMG